MSLIARFYFILFFNKKAILKNIVIRKRPQTRGEINEQNKKKL